MEEYRDVVHFEGGGVRDDSRGRGMFSVISTVGLTRLGQRYEYGHRKYGASDNYKKGLPISGCMDSIMRHWMAYLDGDNSEDHMAAIAWNAFCIMENEVMNPEYQDIPARRDNALVGTVCTNYKLPSSRPKMPVMPELAKGGVVGMGGTGHG